MSDCCQGNPDTWNQIYASREPEPCRVMLMPDEVGEIVTDEMVEQIVAHGRMILIRGPKELLDQIRVL